MGKLRFRRVSAKGWWWDGGTARWPQDYSALAWDNIPWGPEAFLGVFYAGKFYPSRLKP